MSKVLWFGLSSNLPTRVGQVTFVHLCVSGVEDLTSSALSLAVVILINMAKVSTQENMISQESVQCVYEFGAETSPDLKILSLLIIYTVSVD